jgi:hypothetical protein
MKKIALSIVALAAVSSTAFASSAFEGAMKRNMLENPDRYPISVQGASVAGDALAIESTGIVIGNKKFVGPGEDGNDAR